MSILRCFYIILCLLQGCLAATCYFPNSKNATADAPCDPDAEVSPCCARKAGNVCLENGLCQQQTGHRSRGSCTDQAWNSGKCPRYCLEQESNGAGLKSCAKNTGYDTSFCCWNSSSSCCSSGIGRFDVLPSKPNVWATFDPYTNQYRVVLSASTALPTPTSTSTSKVTKAASPAVACTTTSAMEMATQTVTAYPVDSTSRAEGLSPEAKMGLALGIPLGLILILSGAFLLKHWHHPKQTKNPLATDGSGTSITSESSGWTETVFEAPTGPKSPVELPARYSRF